MRHLRLLLLPFSALYGLAVWLRNRLYDWGGFKSSAFDIPVIVVGNLAVGGTGKSPMTEYLIRLLSDKYRVATLSRGYGRKTKGYVEVTAASTAEECGDEPLQFKRKFPRITVAVCEDRVYGVTRLKDRHDVILLDDAYQHRALKPGLSILLFDYHATRRTPKFLFPAGNYRDCLAERRRADILIVTKTPPSASLQERLQIKQRLSVRKKDIPVLFAGVAYGPLHPMPLFGPGGRLNRFDQWGSPLSPQAGNETALHPEISVLLVTGIANPKPLYNYLQPQVRHIVHMKYPDHHRYTPANLKEIENRFAEITNPSKLIITTEKDIQRLSAQASGTHIERLPIHYIPIHMVFDGQDAEVLHRLVLDYYALATKG